MHHSSMALQAPSIPIHNPFLISLYLFIGLEAQDMEIAVNKAMEQAVWDGSAQELPSNPWILFVICLLICVCLGDVCLK